MWSHVQAVRWAEDVVEVDEFMDKKKSKSELVSNFLHHISCAAMHPRLAPCLWRCLIAPLPPPRSPFSHGGAECCVFHRQKQFGDWSDGEDSDSDGADGCEDCGDPPLPQFEQPP